MYNMKWTIRKCKIYFKITECQKVNIYRGSLTFPCHLKSFSRSIYNETLELLCVLKTIFQLKLTVVNFHWRTCTPRLCPALVLYDFALIMYKKNLTRWVTFLFRVSTHLNFLNSMTFPGFPDMFNQFSRCTQTWEEPVRKGIGCDFLCN